MSKAPTLLDQLQAMNPGAKVVGKLATKPLPKTFTKPAKTTAPSTPAAKAEKSAKTPKVKAETTPKTPKVKAEKVAKVVHPDGTIFFREDRQKWIAMGFGKYSGKQEAARNTKAAVIEFLKKKYNFVALEVGGTVATVPPVPAEPAPAA
jgi:hypothetical protein